MSVDPVESEPPYQYVGGNVVNWIDQSGLCAEFGDDQCWAIYEKIVFLCPECTDFQRATFTGDRYLHEENVDYLKTVLKRVQDGWRPSFSAYWKLNKAISNSKQTDTDGFIIGIAGGKSNLLRQLGILNPPTPMLIENECWTASGYVGGLEVVYDFVHQERGLFSYEGSAANHGSLYSLSGITYVGLARGFSNNGYEDGVTAYGGPFASIGKNPNIPFIDITPSFIEAAPLDTDHKINPNGVFATATGVGAGWNISLPGTVDFAVTDYTSLNGLRVKYVNSPLISDRMDVAKRKTAARTMTAELTALSAIYSSGGIYNLYFQEAINKIWDWASRP